MKSGQSFTKVTLKDPKVTYTNSLGHLAEDDPLVARFLADGHIVIRRWWVYVNDDGTRSTSELPVYCAEQDDTRWALRPDIHECGRELHPGGWCLTHGWNVTKTRTTWGQA